MTVEYDNLLWRNENRTVADDIRIRVSLLCWIMTYPRNHMRQAIHIKRTWGKRCDILLFMSTGNDQRLPTVKLQTHEGKFMLWGKTQAAMRYIYTNYLNQAEWFLKADDDTYVIVENLKYMLNDYNTNDPIYFGYKIRLGSTKNGYFSGGASYVLSREALTRLVSKGLDPKLCNTSPIGYAEDLDLTLCLDKLGVTPMDSRDEYERGRFFPFVPNHHVDATIKKDYWFWVYNYYPLSTGRDCCSEFTISFHYINRNMMYVLEYFVYHLRPFGVVYEYHQIYN
ncbi:glycoprotein-N-acetylgalactosamine 3-beta-galactosyltransferase 1-like isoform X2 [Plodia interpunctella]|nr:glycoprotein-N-acetylgalactosamine 3-beta-galactosyltransferase 1-like isoform X2 [Plodia interpunctella]